MGGWVRRAPRTAGVHASASLAFSRRRRCPAVPPICPPAVPSTHPRIIQVCDHQVNNVAQAQAQHGGVAQHRRLAAVHHMHLVQGRGVGWVKECREWVLAALVCSKP